MDPYRFAPGNVVAVDDRFGTFNNYISKNKARLKMKFSTLTISIFEIKPVEITFEILMSSGFVKECDWYILPHGKHDFTIIYDEPFQKFKISVSGFRHEIKYVHQLQNLYFTIYQKELQIQLP